MKRYRSNKRIFNETSEAPVWYLQLWESISDTTHNRDAISRFDHSGFLRSFITTIMPAIASVLLIAPCVNTWDAIKNFYHASNKNFDKTLDLLVNIFMTGTSVAVMITLLAGVVYISPYILLVALSVSTAYGLFNIVKHAYCAYTANQENDRDRCRQHLLALPRHIILSVLSVLGLLTHLHTAFNITVISGVFNAVNFSNTTYNVAEILVYLFGFMMTLGTMPSFARKVMTYNRETLELIKHPITTFRSLRLTLSARLRQGYANFRDDPGHNILYLLPNTLNLLLEFGAFAVMGATRAFSALLAPVQIVGELVSKVIWALLKSLHNRPRIVNLAEDPIPVEEQWMTAHMVRDDLRANHNKLKLAVTAEIAHLKTKMATPKIMAKLCYMRNLENKIGTRINEYDHLQSLAAIEAEAKDISPQLYQSFWRQEGRVEKIERMAQQLDWEMGKAKGLGYVECQYEREEKCAEEVDFNTDGVAADSPFIRGYEYGKNLT